MQEACGWEPFPYRWATAGYWGAIRTGRTICGTLFGATVFLGFLHGKGTGEVPSKENPRWGKAVASVQGLYEGFLEKFGNTDCRSLTGCDLSIKEDRKRYYAEEIYKERCFKFFEYVVGLCLKVSKENAG